MLLQGCQYFSNAENNATETRAPTNTATLEQQGNSNDEIKAPLISFSDDFSAAQKDQITATYIAAEKKLQAILGERNISTLNAKLCQQCGNGFFGLGTNNQFSNNEYLAYDLLRAWILEEADARLHTLRKNHIPAWFLQGFAAAASEDPRFSESNYLSKVTLPPSVDLAQLQSNTQWRWNSNNYASDEENIALLMATQLVRSWYQYSSGSPLIRIITEINFGAEFDLVHSHLIDIYSAVSISEASK